MFILAKLMILYLTCCAVNSELKEGFNEELRSVVENIHAVVDQNEEGIFSYGPFTFNIKKKNNLMQTYKKQLTTDKLISSQKFIFV